MDFPAYVTLTGEGDRPEFGMKGASVSVWWSSPLPALGCDERTTPADLVVRGTPSGSCQEQRSAGYSPARGRAACFCGRSDVSSLIAGAAHAARTDVVVLENRNRFTGGIQGMSRGTLALKTDDAGRLCIEFRIA